MIAVTKSGLKRQVLMTMFTFIIAIDDKALFQRTANYHVQETSSLTTLLLLVWQKTSVPVFLVEIKFLELFSGR